MTATSSGPESELVQRELDRRRGRLVPWIIAAFYATFTTTLIGFVVIAYRNPPSEVTSEAYEKGLAYNDTIEKADVADALGWRSTTTYGRGLIQFELRDNRGRMIDAAVVRAWFVHPAEAANDRTVDLQSKGNGLYQAAVALPQAGLWTIHVTAEKAGRQYQAVTRIEVQ